MGLMFEGWNYLIRVQSPEAHKQFDELVKAHINSHLKIILYAYVISNTITYAHIIDRYTDSMNVGKIVESGLLNIRTSNDYEYRRKIFMNYLGLNSSSKYIPLIINRISKIMKEWRIGGTFQMVNQMNKLTFSIITSILFGSDISSFESKFIDYENENGQIEKLLSRDHLIKLTKDMFENFFNPLSMFFPFVSVYSLVNPFRRNKRNINRFKQSVLEEVNNSKDKDSIWNMILSHQEIPKNALIDDLISFILGGTDTSAHLITSCIYFLMKNEDKLKKLRQEIEKAGLNSFSNIDDLITRESIQQMDYLNYVIKEALRLDGFYESLSYITTKNTAIWGVSIPKDTMIRLDFSCRFRSTQEWQRPTDFIPERFDPTSEFFACPSTEMKSRTIYSHTPFSHGARSCPGQAFGLLQTKIILIYLLTQVDYILDPEIMKKESVGFNVLSKFDLPFTIVKL